ncbi:hypothetical protein RD792_002885 [Penstemon davidsonii]|uniref:Amino acid transporter transmembrane domain-containing protein n=1 Tax=Penstemon davidsonii TaxID=160366 RepID=A0ABR0DTB6_9LAMI|nr:hypothetical protein RD792_002885 [Penstemon davidsonii]
MHQGRNDQQTLMDGNVARCTPAAADLNSWLPISASREGKWWYSAFHNVTAMVGAGVLGLPLVLAQLGWYPGIIAILVSWMVTLYTLWQLIHLHELVPGKRFDRYSELGQHVLGDKLGSWVVMPQQLIVQIGSNILYTVTGGKSLKKCVGLLLPMADFKKTYYILFFTVLQLILSQLPNFNSLKVISLTAALMSIGYSVIATAASIVRGTLHPGVARYGFHSHTKAGIIFDVFASLGTLAFAFAGHSVALEIQATIPSTPENPSKKPMWKGVVAAYIIVAMCYFSVAISGFWAFGDSVEDDVLMSLEHPNWLISVANFMVFIHVLGSYQVFAMPVFDKMESVLVQKFNFTPGRQLRLVARSVYVAMTGAVGIAVPFFGGLLGFFGGLSFATTSYLIPCIIWLVTHKPKKWSFHWIACWISIFIGIVITSLAPIGGARNIVTQWTNYTMFS